jgi:hypothetical protein
VGTGGTDPNYFLPKWADGVAHPFHSTDLNNTNLGWEATMETESRLSPTSISTS